MQIGPGPEDKSDLESIKAAVSSLRPYILKKAKEQLQSVNVLEVYPTGESGYKSTLTLTELLVFIHSNTVKMDGGKVKGDISGLRTDSSTEDLKTAAGGGKAAADGGESEEPPLKGSSNSSRFTGMREVQYHDLRHLESQFNVHEEPTVLVRRHAVLVSFNPLRAIVTANKILLIVPNGADALLYLLHEHMHDMVEDETAISPSPEQRFYHAIFSTVVALHHQEYVHISSRVEKVLQRFKVLKTVTIDVQEHIRILKNSVSSQYVKVNAYRRVLRDLLDSPDDVALLNLSLLKERPELYERPLQADIINSSEEIHILIESYLMDYNALETKLSYVKAQIQNAEDLMSFRLDAARNELLIADTVLAVMMLVVAFATFISSLFGMNLESGIESAYSPDVFWVFSAFLVIGIVLFTWLGFSYYRVTGILPTKPTKFRPIGFEHLDQSPN
jgi:Mg2+ and Co2+ transporter CorA